MSVEELALVACVVFAGLWSGLLGMLTLVMHPMIERWTGRHYDVILAWDPNSMPADWEGPRRRYFTYNWIRAACTWRRSSSSWAALLEFN